MGANVLKYRCQYDREPNRIVKKQLSRAFFKRQKKSEVGGRHLVKNFPGSSRLQRITRCSLAKEEKYNSYLGDELQTAL